MAKKSGKEPEERQLFHGTSPDTAKAICQQGFDWRKCGKHGTVYGKASSKIGNGEWGNGDWGNGDWERGTGNGESLKGGISKMGNL